MLGLKFIKVLMSILKWQVNFSSNFVSFFIFMTHKSSVDFKMILFLLWIRFWWDQNPSFETFKSSGKNLPYSSCHFRNLKSVFLQIFHHPSKLWKMTPLYFFRSSINTLHIFHCNNFEYFCVVTVVNCLSYFFYLLLQVMHSVFGDLPCAHVKCMGYFLI